jgi:hypothetical protein
MRRLGLALTLLTGAAIQVSCSGGSAPPAEAPKFRMGNGTAGS